MAFEEASGSDTDEEGIYLSEEEYAEIHSCVDRGDMIGPDQAEQLAARLTERRMGGILWFFVMCV